LTSIAELWADDVDAPAHNAADDCPDVTMVRQEDLPKPRDGDVRFDWDADSALRPSSVDEPGECDPAEASAGTPPAFEGGIAPTELDLYPRDEAPASAVTAAIARLSEFVDSVRVETPLAGISGSEANLGATETPPRPAPERERGSAAAVKQLAFEVARIAEMMDVRLERIEIVGANQVAELRVEIEQVIVGLIGRIEEAELRSAIAAGAFARLPSPPENPDDADLDLFEDDPASGSAVSAKSDVLTVNTPCTSSAAAPSQSPLDRAISDPSDGDGVDLTTDHQDGSDVVLASADPPDPPNSASKSESADEAGAGHGHADKRFWRQVRETLFQRYL